MYSVPDNFDGCRYFRPVGGTSNTKSTIYPVGLIMLPLRDTATGKNSFAECRSHWRTCKMIRIVLWGVLG